MAEQEIRQMMKSENIDIIFLTETDSKALVSEDNYSIQKSLKTALLNFIKRVSYAFQF